MVARSQQTRLVQLGRLTLHLVRDQDPKVPLDARDSTQELLRLFGSTQIGRLLRAQHLAQICLELRRVEHVLDALPAVSAFACRARAAVGGLVRVVQKLVVCGGEADFSGRQGDARAGLDVATVHLFVGEVGGLALLAACVVEGVGNDRPLHLLVVAHGHDEDALWVFLWTVASRRLAVWRRQSRDVCLNFALHSTGVLKSIHGEHDGCAVLGQGVDLVKNSVQKINRGFGFFGFFGFNDKR